MDVSRGISIEEAKGLKLQETWLPVTPQGSHNWYGAATRGIKLPTEFVQATPNASSHHSQFHNWESPGFSSSTGNGNTLWNSLPFTNLLALANDASGAPADSAPTLPFSLPNNAKSAANMVMEHMYSNHNNQPAPYGFPVPYASASAPTTMYHLNSSPTTLTIPDAANLSLQSASKNTHTGMYTCSPPVMGSAVQDNWIYLEAMSNATTPSLFAPLTPQKQHQLVNGNVNTSYLESSQVQLSTPSNQNQDPEPHKLSTPLKENHHLETEEENRIDLNKTPQQKQQKPRRKKHRPRVVTEKKPRAPKSAAEKKDVKRKYVRRRANSSSTPSADVAGKEPNRCITPRSCKRSLNFDQQSQTHEGHGNIPIQQEKDVAGETKEPNRCITPRSCKRSLNFDQQSQTHEGHGKMPIQEEKETFQILNNTLDVALHPNYSATQMFGEHIPLPQSTTFPTRRELLRKNLEVLGRNEQEFSAIVDCENTGWKHPQLNAHAPFNPKKVYEGSEDVKKGVMLFPHIYKKRRTMSKASKSYGATVANGQSEVIGHYKKNNATSDKMMCFELVSSIRQPEVKTRKRTKGHTRVRDLATLTSIVQCNSMMSTKARYSRKEANGNSFSKATYSRKKSNGNSFSSENDTRVQELVLHGHHHYSNKSRDALKVVQQIKSPIEDLLQRLNLVSGVNEQNALVPFKGDDRIVPYESKLDPFNKKRSRAKVELDSETDRVWKLLMGKEASEGAEGTDVDKEKWWEEERRIFRGRAESFIARMHLIQGDRRFSKWNGSVLDSVIGVFLTQNVSDHLSSSAFISLAAKFPAKRTSNDEMRHEEETRMCPEEPEIEVLQSDNINWHGNMRYEPIISQDSQGSVILNDADCIEQKEMERITEVESYSVSPQNSTKSSLFQVMEDSSKWPANKKGEIIKSCSDSNSEEEDPSTMCKLNCPSSCVSFTELLHSSIFQECYNSANECLSIDLNSNIQSETGTCKQPYLDTINAQSPVHPSSLGTPHNCFLPATSDTGFLEVQCPEIGSSQGTREITEQSTPLDTQAAAISLLCSSLNKQSVDPNTSFEQEVDPLKQLNSWGNSVSKNDQIYMHHEGNQSSKPEIHDARSQKTDAQKQPVGSNSSNVSGETVEVVESSMLFNKKYSRRSGNVESVTKEQVHSSSSPNEKTVNASKPNGKKPKEKQKVIDWDNLRKEAYKQYGKRERTSDTMDSVDWEAVRLADVNVIADCIKARGMNNMLAERIKDFLNRLVREHESADLEWLRDVHPDKAKEYLLSVRGLGLKSVECIRLLTLHHLAFPVDTNVGRIAVRLGWVPLQQLPESLQLHLLEMYPIQESIQKYLWPRLCTLDQPTLYNLHYHMITFGKVFCTKNKPNCNACVMRAECRHFASAFASARLALPGPEEKGIVSLTVPPIPHESESVSINPTLALPPQEKGSVNSAVPNYSTEVGADKMPPPPLEVNMQSETGTILANSEPIIEVPASPEPECNEMLGSDIEDAFWEDPDEIPTIKLNFENFTFNLQNYMQENNIELQDGDMSKSLVTLNPEAASIPTPKLKNVGRLRTEHQVFELPDSHPLLEGVERRVRGEVCSYLLAIWTPGETAESTQPPQRCCDSQISGNNLCTEKTCLSCNNIRETNSQTVRGTLLIPCKTAMRGSFPLNGTYFQVNEVFADHDSSLNPIDVPRTWLWNLPRRTVYFGTSIPTIFRGQSTEQIQSCFWKGYVCVRGFERKTRAPRPLMARLHFPASRLAAREKSKRHQ